MIHAFRYNYYKLEMRVSKTLRFLVDSTLNTTCCSILDRHLPLNSIFIKTYIFLNVVSIFYKTIYPSTIEAPAYSRKSLFKQTWNYTTRECFNRSIFFMVYGFHPPLPLPWIMISTKLNSVYLNMFSTQLPTYQTKLFLKRKDL